jgi:hypothetical protein
LGNVPLALVTRLKIYPRISIKNPLNTKQDIESQYMQVKVLLNEAQTEFHCLHVPVNGSSIGFQRVVRLRTNKRKCMGLRFPNLILGGGGERSCELGREL